MVRRAPKRSLRLASCCSVDVVNGAYGRSVRGVSSTDVDPPRRILEPRDQRAGLRLVEQQDVLPLGDAAGLLVEVLAGREALAIQRDEARLELGAPVLPASR